MEEWYLQRIRNDVESLSKKTSATGEDVRSIYVKIDTLMEKLDAIDRKLSDLQNQTITK